MLPARCATPTISHEAPPIRTSCPTGSILGKRMSATSDPTNTTRRPSSTSVEVRKRPWATVTPLAGS